MAHLNIEIKARCTNADHARRVLQTHQAEFRGLDRQVDTYFRCETGRLKLREGTIERQLIYYQRPDDAGPKASQVILYPAGPDSGALRELLSAALGVWQTVRKSREIYFISNVKFHIDAVEGLGDFLEIEAIDRDGTIGREALERQCRHYMQELEIRPEDLIDKSYSDLLALP